MSLSVMLVMSVGLPRWSHKNGWRSSLPVHLSECPSSATLIRKNWFVSSLGCVNAIPLWIYTVCKDISLHPQECIDSSFFFLLITTCALCCALFLNCWIISEVFGVFPFTSEKAVVKFQHVALSLVSSMKKLWQRVSEYKKSVHFSELFKEENL